MHRRSCARVGLDPKELRAFDVFFGELDAAMAAAAPEPRPPSLSLPPDFSVHRQHASFALWGRFRNDVSVESLAGGTEVRGIELPVPLTRIPDSVGNHVEAATALRACVELCCLMDNQLGRVRNSYLHRAALVRHLFTRVLPLPLPVDHPKRDSWCFWAKESGNMRFATQIELMRLLSAIAAEYAAVSLSIYSSNSFDATRMLVMGCIACIADAVLRVQACDAPSIVSQQYSGLAPSPGLPFTLDIGDYAQESEAALFAAPDLAIARSQVLDYFHSQKALVKDDWHTIFRFHRGTQVGIGHSGVLCSLHVRNV